MLVGTDGCRAPRCRNGAEEGSRWCKPCGAVLARVREELAKDEREKRYSRALRVRSSCKWFECPDPRKPGEPYCLYHLRMAASVLP